MITTKFAWLKSLFRKPLRPPRVETASERVTRMRKALKCNPTTGELLITQRYKDACVDEVIEYLKGLR